MKKHLLFNLLVSSAVFLTSGCYRFLEFKTEKGKNGDISLISKNRSMIVNNLKNYPRDGEELWAVSVDGLPTVSYYGLESKGKYPRYSEFITDEHGFIYDRDFDGFPDEALTREGEIVKLQIWAISKDGKRRLFKK